ncbi:MAG: flagellar export protein FliJ [Lachnospiraceae bacterium]|nr:flagellar export protein FliJ [Lachnospiraceae bacterium]
MAKFIFKFENILKIKYKVEEQRKAEFGMAMKRLEDAKQSLVDMLIRQDEYEILLTELAQNGASALELKQASEKIDVIKVYVVNIKEQIVIEEGRVEIARNNFNEAMKERKIFEKLKEKEFERFKLEVNAQEMKEVDELVSFKYSDRA